MVSSILRQIYMGSLAPQEQYEPLVQEHIRRREEVVWLESHFVKQLSEELKKEFIQIIDERTGLLPYECEQIFIQGMRLGAQLVVELTQRGADYQEE